MKDLRRRWLIAACLVIALAAGFLLFRGGRSGEAAGDGQPPQQQAQAMPVPVAPVVKKTVPIYLEYIGTASAIRAVTLQAQVTGYLQKVAMPDGAEVKEGDLLYQIDPRPFQAALDQAQAQLQRDQAALQYAQANYQRNAALARRGDASVDVAQQAQSTAQQAQAAIAADRAAIEAAQINLEHTAIKAPFAGKLSLTQVHEGALITSSNTVLNTLVQIDPIYATFAPPDTDLPQIGARVAQGPIPADVTVPSDTGRHYQGQLTFLDNSVGATTGTISAHATVDNPDHSLLPGQFVRVRLHIGDQPNTLLVPQVAVGSSQLGKYLYLLGAGDKVEQRYVTLGNDYGEMVAVTKGVSQGQSVITGNLLKISPGMAVKPVEATATGTAAQGSG